MFSNKRVSMPFIFLNLLILLFSSCSDLEDNKVVKREIESQRFRVECVMDVNAFADIWKKNISSDLKCLEENLNLFLKVVKTDRPGFLSIESLEQFVVKNRPDIKPDMIRAMRAIFDINYLITGEDPGYISSTNVKKLIEFALLLNERSSQHFDNTFGNERKTPLSIFRVQRNIVTDVSRELVVAARKVFVSERGDKVHQINLLDMLDSFATDDTRDEIEKAKKLLFVKKLFLGGESYEITHKEFDFLLMNLPSLLPVFFDVIRLKNVYWREKEDDQDFRDVLTQASLIEILEKDTIEIDEIINDPRLASQDKEVLFTIDELIDSLKIFLKDSGDDIDKYSNIGREAKKILLGGNLVDVRGIEIKKLINHAKTLLKTSSAIHLFFNSDSFKKMMTSTQPIKIDLNNYAHVFPGLTNELKIFNRIAKNYRFFLGSFKVPFYESGIRRNPDGMVEIYALEYLIKLMFQEFGAISPNSGNPFGYSIDQFQTQALFKKFQKDLINLDLLSPLWPTITTDNVSLLGTLFQLQSDTNQVMDVNEASEFGINLFSSMIISDDLFEYFKTKKCEFDEFGRVEPNCLREHFFQALCTNYRNHMPLFFASLGTTATCENIPRSEYNSQFLNKSAQAARICGNYTDGEKEEIYFSQSDVNTMIMVMLHSEITILKWDKNKDNILNPDEINDAYTLYGL